MPSSRSPVLSGGSGEPMPEMSWSQIRRAARLDEYGEDEIDLLWIAIRILAERIKQLDGERINAELESADRVNPEIGG